MRGPAFSLEQMSFYGHLLFDFFFLFDSTFSADNEHVKQFSRSEL